MKKHSDRRNRERDRFQDLIGLGDLSARKSYYPELLKTIEDLRKEKEKYKRIFSDALNGIFQATIQGTSIMANPAIAEICGYDTPEEFIGTVRDIGRHLFYKTADMKNLMDRLLKDGFVVDYETEFNRKDKEVIIVSMNARLNETPYEHYIEFFVQDITERKRTEQALSRYHEHLEELVRERTGQIEKAHQSLKDSEERFRSLSEASFEGIIIIDQLTIIEANKTIGKMFGYAPSETIGMAADQLVVSDERERVQNKILTGDERAYETTGLKKDGTAFPMAIQAKMFSYKGQQVRVSAIRDITEQKKAEAEIKTLRGILPICSSCKKIRDDKGYWNQIESYIKTHSKAQFSHSICPQCAQELYGEYVDEDEAI